LPRRRCVRPGEPMPSSLPGPLTTHHTWGCPNKIENPDMWITRVNLWINTPRCGQTALSQRFPSQTLAVHTARYGGDVVRSPKYGCSSKSSPFLSLRPGSFHNWLCMDFFLSEPAFEGGEKQRSTGGGRFRLSTLSTPPTTTANNGDIY